MESEATKSQKAFYNSTPTPHNDTTPMKPKLTLTILLMSLLGHQLLAEPVAPEAAKPAANLNPDSVVIGNGRRKLFSVKAAEVRRKARWMDSC